MNRRFLTLLALIWLALCGYDAWLRVRTGFGIAHYNPGEQVLDATNQIVRDGPQTDAKASPGAFLQVALLQISLEGLSEAVLCAREVPLYAKTAQHLSLYFQGAWPDASWRGGRRLGREYYENKPRQPGSYWVGDLRVLPGEFGQPERNVGLDFVWEGQSAGVHFVRMTSSSSRAGEARLSNERDVGPLPSCALTEGQPAFFLSAENGCVFAMQITTQSAVGAQLSTRSFWHERARRLVGAPKVTAEQVQTGLRQLAIPAEGAPFFAPVALVSQAVASLTFQDRELAANLLLRAAELGEKTELETAIPDRGLGATQPGGVVALAASRQFAEMFAGRSQPAWDNPFSFEPQWILRCLILSPDAGVAQHCADMLGAMLLDDCPSNLPTVVHPDIAPAALPAWNGLLERVSAHAWPHSALGRLLVLLAPLAFGFWLAFGGRRHPARPVRLSAWSVLLLAPLVGATVCVPLYPLAILVFAVLLARRRREHMPMLDRLLAALAVAGGCLWGALLIWSPTLTPVLEVVVAFANFFAWVVVGGWVLLDGQWRAPAAFALSLVCNMTTTVLLLAGVSMQVLQDGAMLSVVVSFFALVFFLFAGHRHAEPAAEPAPEPAMAG
ncbi:MAG: hypothetical protein IT456_12630 [Planctomycetes bacterium]|nr:hypothetical protein [Planctomycetota bacterium]